MPEVGDIIIGKNGINDLFSYKNDSDEYESQRDLSLLEARKRRQKDECKDYSARAEKSRMREKDVIDHCSCEGRDRGDDHKHLG